ncbi:hypothetical protein BDAP_002848 [Binucleata daphniae]
MILNSYKIFYKQNRMYYKFELNVEIPQHKITGCIVYFEIFPTKSTIFDNFLFYKIDAIYDNEFDKADFDNFITCVMNKNAYKNTKVYKIFVKDVLQKLHCYNFIHKFVYEYKIKNFLPKKQKIKQQINKQKVKIDKNLYKHVKLSASLVYLYEKLKVKNDIAKIYRKIKKYKKHSYKILVVIVCVCFLDVQSLVFMLQNINLDLLRYHERIFFTYWLSTYFYTNNKAKLGYYYNFKTQIIIQDAVNMQFKEYLAKKQICQPGWQKAIHELCSTIYKTSEDKSKNLKNAKDITIEVYSDDSQYIQGIYVPKNLVEKQTIKCREYVNVIIENKTDTTIFVIDLRNKCETQNLKIYRPVTNKLHTKIQLHQNISICSISYTSDNVEYIQKIDTVYITKNKNNNNGEDHT